ncbi:MAG: RNA polymerase sigma factor, partial [Candidatus Poribacteria bacterium]|nr:RNA polymerase sigma factor [Candidatus Poribacteria bacterium]
MLENDVQLIQRILSGDDSAFNTLVERHQKGVHALIWRKIGDFHYAEELTQDVFLQVYKKLGTLKEHKCFAGWLYVIAHRLTLNWIQRHKPAMQSLEETPLEEIDESSYTHYVTLEREADAAEQNSEIVKKLLKRLPESERTVVTLYYLGEMTVREIGNFLGVSVDTIKSRLRRGRERLQASKSLVSEVLRSVQLPADLTARIMRQVADINPTIHPSGKPLVPWVSFGAATILVMFLLGVSQQYLTRFQKPYSFEARSEPTIEIIDAPIVLDVVSKPSIRSRFGRSAAPGKNVGAG